MENQTPADVSKHDTEQPESPTSPQSTKSFSDAPRQSNGDLEKQGNELARTQSTKSIAETLSLPHEIAFVSLICLAQFTTQVGLGQCLAILHVIGDSFGISNPGELSWLIAAYSLTVGTFIIFSGRLGDIFGYKRMLIIGFSWFSFWSMVAGLAIFSNSVLFNFARALQGIGPSIILPNGLAILGASYAPGPRKAMVFAFFGACAPGGSIVGSAFAGLFALTWWPWAFWSFSIALAFISILGIYIIPSPPLKSRPSSTFRAQLLDMDLPGAILGVTGLVLVNFAWNQAPIVGWDMPYVYVTLILGFVFLSAFFYNEIYLARAPLIPFSALTTDVAFVLACVACGWACFGIWVFYTWQFAQQLKGASPLLTSAYFAPVAVSGAIASIVTGLLLGRIHPAWVMLMALTFFTTGAILIATAPVHQSYWAQFFVCTVIMPWGMDMSFPAATLILSNAVKKEHQGIGASLVNTVVNYSISLALGFAGTVEVHIGEGRMDPEGLLKGYRSALYLAIGLSGLGMGVSAVFLGKSLFEKGKK